MPFLQAHLIILACCSIKTTYTATFYTSNSAFGLFAAIAVPLDLPHRNVFVSYNFEANYNLPQTWVVPPYAIFAAIAVPLDLPHRNVFVSYNFEANYNLPATWDVPPYAVGVEEEDIFEDVGRFNNGRDCNNCTSSSSSADNEEDDDNYLGDESDLEESSTNMPGRNETDSNSSGRKRRRRKIEMPSLLTRKHFYRILVDKFERSGFEGEPCLLRLICETNASELGEINGVLGNLIHIMFSPTTSRNENLPLIYYQAEVDGIHEQCHHYEKECSESILDLISAPIHQIIDELQQNDKS